MSEEAKDAEIARLKQELGMRWDECRGLEKLFHEVVDERDSALDQRDSALDQRYVARKERDEARAIIDARLCEGHANAKGVFSHQEGEGVTPKGGGCAVCIGERVEAECEKMCAALRKIASASSCPSCPYPTARRAYGHHTVTVAREALGLETWS